MSWPQVALREICEFKYGKSLPRKVRDGGGLPVFGSNGPVDTHSEALFDGPGLVIGRKGSFGEVHFAEHGGWPIDTTYYVDAQSTECDLRWLFYRLKSLGLKELNRAAAIPGLNREDAYRLTTALPPLVEQKRIAAILDKADDLRRKRREALALLDTLIQSIFVEMFGDPVSNPMGWKQKQLSELCDVGSSRRVFVKEFVEEGVPFFRGTEVGKLATNERIEPELFVTEDRYKELVEQSGKPETGDLLLPSICPDGRIWQVNTTDPFYFKDGRVLWIKSGQAGISPEYLRRFLQVLFAFHYEKIASGTTFSELKIVNLKAVNILWPPADLQRSFTHQVEAVDRIRQQAVECGDASKRLFASLQARAFNGTL